MPEPVLIKVKQGNFELNKSTAIISTDGRTNEVANMMMCLLKTTTGYHIKVKNRDNKYRDNVIMWQK